MDDVKEILRLRKNKKLKNIEIKLSNKVQILIETVIVILFVVLTLIIAQFHEFWFDEAQSFLLARDNSFKEIFHYIRYEGTPPLWVIIIKIFLKLGGNNSNFYIISIFFSTIGVALFEYNKKIPFYLKLLFPFSYYIFFQYTITVRSYCLILPAVMLIYNFYDTRLTKPWSYVLSLILFMGISLHTLGTAGMLFLFFTYDLYIDFRKNKKINKNCFIALIVLMFSILIVLFVTIPAADCNFAGNSSTDYISIINEAFIKGRDSNFISYILRVVLLNKIPPYRLIPVIVKGLNLIMFFLICLAFLHIYKDQSLQIIKLNFLLFPTICILYCINCEEWHIGIIFLLTVMYLILTNKVEIRICKIFLIIVLIIQIYWTSMSLNYDIKNNFSGSKNAADFIKENNLLDYTIYGLDYAANSIQIYFDHNIFDNRNSEKAFYFFSNNNPEMTKQEILNNMSDVLIIAEYSLDKNEDIVKNIEEKNYKLYIFDGCTCVKTYKKCSECYYIYIKPDISIKDKYIQI